MKPDSRHYTIDGQKFVRDGDVRVGAKIAASRLHIPLDEYLGHVAAGERHCGGCDRWLVLPSFSGQKRHCRECDAIRGRNYSWRVRRDRSAWPPGSTAACVVCGGGFLARPSTIKAGRAKYCSVACKATALRTGRKKSVGKIVTPCDYCGKEVRSYPSHPRRYCSKACHVATAFVPKDEKQCSRCGEIKPLDLFYRSKTMALGRASYCRECAKAAQSKLNQRRRARLKAAFVEDVSLEQVFIEENGICGLCGGQVDRSNWSLDHIIPISRGGLHERLNVQLAHFLCNAKKGAKLIQSFGDVA